MQFETLFDIDSALPNNWQGMPLGLVVIALFLFARFRPQSLENSSLPTMTANAARDGRRSRWNT